MAKLKLGPITDDKPVRLTVELPANLHRDLVAYGEAIGREAGTDAIKAGKLIGPIIAKFIASDRAFTRAQRLPSTREP